MRFDKNNIPADREQADQEEFEFKPLTQGLGFHPTQDQSRAKEAATTTKKPLTFQSSKTHQNSPSFSTTGSMKESRVNSKVSTSGQATKSTTTSIRSTFLDSPLPRPTTPSTPSPSNSGQAVESILKSLNEKNKNLQFTDKGKPISPYLQIAPGLAAGFLDLLLVTSLGLIYMMSLIFTLKIDLIKTLSEGGPRVWLATAAVFFGVGFVYYTAQRIFLGFTLGDWAYEQRLGLPEEMQKSGYSLKVFWRQVLVMITGVIVLPILSWALGRDLAGVSGLCMYRKR